MSAAFGSAFEMCERRPDECFQLRSRKSQPEIDAGYGYALRDRCLRTWRLIGLQDASAGKIAEEVEHPLRRDRGIGTKRHELAGQVARGAPGNHSLGEDGASVVQDIDLLVRVREQQSTIR